MTGHFVPIWFFIGIILLVYGALILGAGLWELVKPPEVQRTLAHLHPAIWWGALLLVLGGLYTWRFHPRR